MRVRSVGAGGLGRVSRVCAVPRRAARSGQRWAWGPVCRRGVGCSRMRVHTVFAEFKVTCAVLYVLLFIGDEVDSKYPVV